jgi:hypothetical protein
MAEIKKERQLKMVRVPEDLNSIKVDYIQILDIPATHPENESETKKIPVKTTLPFRPAGSMITALKNLRELALDYVGIELADKSKAIKDWTVSCIKLDGDHNLHQAHVTMFLSRKGKYTDKPHEFEVGPITMYPTAEGKAKTKYHSHEQLASAVEDVIAEVFGYMDGTHEAGKNPQLALDLFPGIKDAVTI